MEKHGFYRVNKWFIHLILSALKADKATHVSIQLSKFTHNVPSPCCKVREKYFITFLKA